MTDWPVAGVAATNLLAPAWFLLCWLGFTLFADRQRRRPSLTGSMHRYRELWMQTMLGRDNRMVDIQIVANLMRSASFFASTTVLIIAGSIALLGARVQALAVVRELPFAADTSPLLFDLKMLLLVILFIYAFFKFTWAFRQYNYCLVLIGAIPGPDQLRPDSADIAARAARLATSTARHFNRGIRAYYFGLAALSWFVQPWLFAFLSAWVVLVLYRREFRSHLLATLDTPAAPEAPQ